MIGPDEHSFIWDTANTHVFYIWSMIIDSQDGIIGGWRIERLGMFMETQDVVDQLDHNMPDLCSSVHRDCNNPGCFWAFEDCSSLSPPDTLFLPFSHELCCEAGSFSSRGLALLTMLYHRVQFTASEHPIR